MTPNQKRQIAITLYANLMEEIKVRVQSIEFALNGKTGMLAPLVKEFAYLQIRMICELIALAALVAHGDVTQTNLANLNKRTDADEILKALERIHPDFFPLPFRPDDSDPVVRTIDIRNDTGISKGELLKLYGQCGNHLHRGSYRKLLKPQMPLEKHFPEVRDHVTRIVDLLRFHTMALLDGETRLICIMSTADKNGRVTVSLASPAISTPAASE